MKKVDLHIHTNASDGIFSSKEVIDLAIAEDMKTIAITDHDNMSSIEEALEYSKDKNIEVIPGVEISCDSEKLEICDIHIVGLFIDYKNKGLNDLINNNEKPSMEKAVRIIRRAGGIPVLAHPLIYIYHPKIIIERFEKAGGQAIEFFYYYTEFIDLKEKTKRKLAERFQRILKGKNLLFSGGSDFHGDLKEIKIGMKGINEKDLKKFYQLKEQNQKNL